MKKWLLKSITDSLAIAASSSCHCSQSEIAHKRRIFNWRNISMQVKEIFNSKEELYECLTWWQEKLFLTDWIIKASICPPEDFITKNCCGENEFDMVNKSCVIRILDPKYYGKRIMKYCAEKILVHELLHCKYNWIANEGTYEEKYVDVMEHGLLEQMAKSLIMAKYDLSLNYFKEID